jgi:hypothetical protein
MGERHIKDAQPDESRDSMLARNSH